MDKLPKPAENLRMFWSLNLGTLSKQLRTHPYSCDFIITIQVTYKVLSHVCWVIRLHFVCWKSCLRLLAFSNDVHRQEEGKTIAKQQILGQL